MKDSELSDTQLEVVVAGMDKTPSTDSTDPTSNNGSGKRKWYPRGGKRR